MSMEREETNNSHYAPNRMALWCPVCGAREGQGCTYVEGLRFHGHNNYALGVPRPTVQIPMQWEPTPVRKDAPKRGWTPGGWVQ
jgi:hypothetical protein